MKYYVINQDKSKFLDKLNKLLDNDGVNVFIINNDTKYIGCKESRKSTSCSSNNKFDYINFLVIYGDTYDRQTNVNSIYE